MPMLETATLLIHVAAGIVAVLAGIGALATEKGGLAHRRAGRVFVASMAVVVGTVFPLVALDPSDFRVFLALVAVFSGYLAFSGYRVLARKRPASEASAIDWLGALAVVVACLGLGGWGLVGLGGGETLGVVMVVFGAVGLAFGGRDLLVFHSSDGGTDWVVTHLQRMIAAFIATVSAVSVVNLSEALGVVAWLWPTVAFVPVIVYLSREHSSG